MCYCLDFDSPKSVRQSLFKYYPNKDYHRRAFRDRQLFLAKPRVLNDAFDTSHILIEPYKEFQKRVGWDKEMAARFESHGICSFIEAPDVRNERMWAFYASNYDGFAIEYNEAEFSKQEYAPLALCPVKYIKKPLNLDDKKLTIKINEVTISQAQLDSDRIRTAEYYFKCLHLVKNKKVWGDEHEWRIIKAERNPSSAKCEDKGDGYTLQISDKAYRNLFIGYKVPHLLQCYLSKIAKNRGMGVFVVTPQIIRGEWSMSVNEIN